MVHRPSRWTRLAGTVAAVGLAAGAIVLVAGGRPAGREGGDDRDGGTSAGAYADAVARLGRAGTFAYRGSVRAAEPSPMRPGGPAGTEVTVEGAVLLPASVTREVAIDDHGRAAETVTSGATVWRRTAPGPDDLAEGPWALVDDPGAAVGPWDDVDRPGRLGIALVSDVLRSARNPREVEPDGANRVFRADIPPDDRDRGAAICFGCDRYGDLLAGGQVTVTVDGGGDIARLVVASPGPDPGLVLDLEIERLGDPDLVTPAHVGEPAQGALPAGVLAAGVEAVEVGALPPGWALVDARAGARTSMPPSDCGSLTLDYRDLAAVAEGWLHLDVTSEACQAAAGRMGTGAVDGEPIRAGTYSGTAWGTGGEVSDGTTRVRFQTDMPIEDVADLLASLTGGVTAS